MKNKADSGSFAGGKEHIPYLIDCTGVLATNEHRVTSGNPLVRLSRLLFPYAKGEYPGRVAAICGLLGCAVSSFRGYRLRGGTRLTPWICERAEKVCDAQIRELTAIRNDLAARRVVLERKQAPKRRGCFAVKVRDDTGIPKTALWRDGWRKKPKEPPAF